MTTLEAIDASIEKWRKLIKAEDIREVDLGPADCPLCMKFWDHDENKSCDGCPVYAYSDFKRCRDTPYEDADDAWQDEDLENFRAYAQEEVDYLLKVRNYFLDECSEDE